MAKVRKPPKDAKCEAMFPKVPAYRGDAMLRRCNKPATTTRPVMKGLDGYICADCAAELDKPR